jgi:hypothetical protein
MENPFYLSAGIANQVAIVISPDQGGKPVYFSLNSYDRHVIRDYFERFRFEIADITVSTGISIDIDQELTRYESPRDLLLVDYIIVRSSAGELTDNARRQDALVARFNQDDLSWFDRSCRADLIASAEAHGDLRFRQLNIPDIKFTDMTSFHTLAFGGIFLLRELAAGRSVMIVEEPARVANPRTDLCDVYHIGDPQLLHRLRRERLIDVDLHWYLHNIESLEHLKDCLAADILCSREETLDYASLNPVKKKKIIREMGDEVPAVFDELERLIKVFSSGTVPPQSTLSEELQCVLMHPTWRVRAGEQEVMWKLICRLQKLDVVRLYWSDKNFFFEQYQTWPDRKKEWAVRSIKKRNRQWKREANRRGGDDLK